MFTGQQPYAVRFEWGSAGVGALAPACDGIAIVDVLSFCTAVDVATARGAIVYPYPWADQRATAFAQQNGAQLASRQRATPAAYSLSPSSLLTMRPGERLVLPSPNGATLSLATGDTPTVAGCLRNAAAAAAVLAQLGSQVAVIGAGERWPDGSLRPGVEDLLGAGAIISHLAGTRSPEAAMAEAVFERFRDRLAAVLQECSSGRELIQRGFAEDVRLAAELNVSATAPRLLAGAYRL